MEIDSTMQQFIDDTAPLAIALHGKWGRGKTHYWLNMWEKNKGRPNLPLVSRSHAYVSLFGIDSIDELKYAISQSVEQEAQDSELQTTLGRGLSSWVSKKINLTKRQAQILEKADIKYLTGAAKAYRAFAIHSLKGVLVCLDDIERRGKNLRLLDVLGLISFLREQRSCKVIVILNSESLTEPDRKEWNIHKEKVFNLELAFTPTPEQCVGLVFSPTRLKLRTIDEIAFYALRVLEVSNIRIIERVKRVINQIMAELSEAEVSDDVLRRIARAVCLVCYCNNGAGDGAPPLEFAVSAGRLVDTSGLTEKESEWLGMLRRYNCQLDGPIENAIINVVVTGHFSYVALLKAIRVFKDETDALEAKNRFAKTINACRFSFADNRKEITRALQNDIDAVAPCIRAEEADFAITLLRRIGVSDIANALANKWVLARRGNRARELVDESVEKVQDKRLLQLAQVAFRESMGSPNLAGAIAAFSEKKAGVTEANIVSETSVVQLVNFLDAAPTEATYNAIYACKQLAADHGGKYLHALKNITAALQEIGARSEFCKLRVQFMYPFAMP